MSSADGKIVPHLLAVPLGKIVPHLHLAGLVAADTGSAAEPGELDQLVERLNGILEAAGLGRPVGEAEEYLVTLPLAEQADLTAVLATLRAASDEDARRSQPWPPSDGAPDPAPVTGDSRTVPH